MLKYHGFDWQNRPNLTHKHCRPSPKELCSMHLAVIVSIVIIVIIIIIIIIMTGYRLDGRGVRVHVVQTGSGTHPITYPMSTGNSFLGAKAVGACS
jgi:hypothetical protein